MTIDRVVRLRDKLVEAEIPALLITGLDNLHYVTGFTGTAGAALVSLTGAWFVADPRYIDQVREQCPTYEIVATSTGVSAFEGAMKLAPGLGLERLGFEADHLTFSQHAKLQAAASDLALAPVEGLVEQLRMVKDADEIGAIRQAAEVADATLSYILTVLRPGRTEREVAMDLDWQMRKLGADKEAFDSIVASGPNSAIPHHRPTNRVLQTGEFVKLDFGAYMNGYNSDITRTVVLGRATDRHREIYRAVLEGQLAGIGAVRAGRAAKDVDAEARDRITALGFGEQFGHGLGHGLGMHIHDPGSLNPKSDLTLEAGMVFTVEPGIYVKDFGGVRIEDDVVVRDGPAEVLTHSSKDLQEI